MKKILLFIALMLFAYSLSASTEDGALLSLNFRREVDRKLDVSEADQERYARLLDSALQRAGVSFTSSQYLVLMDRNPYVQTIFLYWLKLYPPSDWQAVAGRLYFIGASPASSGKPSQFDYFQTPVGVFAHTLDNMDYRAEGTFNKNGIRGFGLKGMRVFDFGWVQAKQGWGKGGLGQMRLLIHATDPDKLEKQLGSTRSKGCIRIPATLNTFMDRYGLLDADYMQAQARGEKLWVLRPDRTPTQWPGRYLVIVDSGSKKRPVWPALQSIRRRTRE